MEQAGVQAIAHRENVSVVIAEGTSGGRGEARALIEAVAEGHPELELIAHEQATEAHGAIVWIGEREDAERLKANFHALRGPGGEWRLDLVHGAAFVSLVGLGLGAREAARAEEALERARVPLVALRTTPTALVFRVPGERCADTVKAFHAAFVEERASRESAPRPA